MIKIAEIDESIRARMHAFDDCRLCLLGVAEPVIVRDKDNEVTVPALIDCTGECLVVYDSIDRNDVTIWHKINSVNYSADARSSFGDRTSYTKTTDVSAIVVGRRAYKREVVEMFLVKALLDNGVEAQSSEFNGVQVFASEFSGLAYFINPDYYIFKVNYRITETYNNRGCKNN